MHASLLPFLIFEGHAEQAMTFYVSQFSDGEVLEIVCYPSGQSVLGPVMQARFRIAGQVIRCFDSPIRHEFGFTPAISLFVDCTSEEEIRRRASVLGEGGATQMPLASYGFSRQFAWFTDRFGVSVAA